MCEQAEEGRARLSTSSRPTTVQAALDQPVERLDRKIDRRTDTVGIFPKDRSFIRLARLLCIELNDEWLVGAPLAVGRLGWAAPQVAAPSLRYTEEMRRAPGGRRS
jgi:Transposase, Mutator family